MYVCKENSRNGYFYRLLHSVICFGFPETFVFCVSGIFYQGPLIPCLYIARVFRPTLLVYKGYEDCQGEGVRLNPPPPLLSLFISQLNGKAQQVRQAI